MRNKFSLFAVITAFLISVASCKQDVPPLALHVPKDASFVLAVDPKAIMDKIASSGITIDSLANLFADKKDEYALQWNDIKNSGIDLSKQVYIFSKPVNSMKDGKVNYSGVIAQVEDAKKLEAFLLKEKLGGDVISKGKYKYILLNEDNIAGWTDDIFILSSVTGGLVASGNYRSGEGTPAQLFLNTLLTQSQSESLAASEEFRSSFSKKGDIQFYSNGSANLSSIPMLGMTKLSTLLDGSYTDGVINFENGKAVINAETHNNKTLSDILNKYPSKEIDKDMITSFPGNVSGFGIVSFNPKVLIDILHYLGFDTMVNGYALELGFNINDVINAFSGDIAIVFSGGVGKRSFEGTMGEGASKGISGNFLLNMRIGDKAAFDKVMTALVNKNILTKNGNQYQLGLLGGHGTVIETTGTSLLIASGDELIKTYTSGNNKSDLPADVDKQIKNKSMAMYVDINALFKNSNVGDTSAQKMITAAQSTFKNIIATSDKNDGKTIKGNLELNFVNTNENSLASLAKFIAVAHEEGMMPKRDFNIHHPFQDSIPDMDDAPEKDSQ